jgi:hypothetical protein
MTKPDILTPMYKLREVSDKIWVVEFDTLHNLGMTFLRYQEYYECPNPKFFRNPFLINEYVEWYKDGEDKFTYTLDWSGFNIPSHFILECQESILDHNEWDVIMAEIITKVKEKSGDLFYLLGVKEGDGYALDHEIAHGLFFINKDYQTEMTNLYDGLSTDIKEQVHMYLKETAGYTEVVFMDETQAYMATGLPKELKLLRGDSLPFKEVFKKYNK